MKDGVNFLGHAIHPMLNVFPLGLLVSACAFDVAALSTGRDGFYAIAYWNIVGGVVGGGAAAIFGWLDWAAIAANTRAKRIGLWHGIGNMVLVALFALSGWMRFNSTGYVPDFAALVLSFGALVLGLVTAWLGGELVGRLGVAVDKGAHPDAPSSLSGLPVFSSSVSQLDTTDSDERLAA